MLTTRQIDPAIPSRTPRIGDGVDQNWLKTYCELFPDRANRLAMHAATIALPTSHYGVGYDCGYQYHHRLY